MTAADWITDEAIDAAFAQEGFTGEKLRAAVTENQLHQACLDNVRDVVAAALDTLIEQGVICRRPSRKQIENKIVGLIAYGADGELAVDAIEALLDGSGE
jgi:hypothetical protein